MSDKMNIEFEFYFEGEFDDVNIKHEAWYAISNYIKSNQDLGNIGNVELVELVDWDEGESGIHCCAVITGSEKDLRYLVFKNVGIKQGPDGFLEPEECHAAWNNCVEILTNEEINQ